MALIDRDALLNKSFTYPIEYAEYIGEDTRLTELVLADTIKSAPSVDAALVVHARWVDTGADYWERGRTSTRYKCSNCGRKAGEKQVMVYFYCPKCGARMNKEENYA